MNKISCTKKGNVIAITVGNEYEVISENETRYSIINDKGIQKNYCKSLFKKVDEPVKKPKKPVPPPAPIVPIVNEIDVETSVTQSNDNDVQLTFNINCTFGNHGSFIKSFNNCININRIKSSCGIGSIDGLDNLIGELEEFKDNLHAYINQNINNFILNNEINIDELISNITEGLIQDLIASFQDHNQRRFGILLLSTTTDSIGDNLDLERILNEASTSTITTNNPNSGNEITMWSIVVNP